MFRERVQKYMPGIYDSATMFNRNVLSLLRAINGGITSDNLKKEGIPSSLLTDKIAFFVKDTRGPALNNRTHANRQLGGWTQGVEYVIAGRSEVPYALNSVEFEIEESANVMVHWNGELSLRNTGKYPFKLAAITLLLDGEKIPGGRWMFTDRFSTELDGPWGANTALLAVVVGGWVDKVDWGYEFLQSVSAGIVIPPGHHRIEAVLTVAMRNYNTGDYLDVTRPSTYTGVGLDAHDWAGHFEHLDGQDTSLFQHRTRTIAVCARQLSVYGFTK